MSRLLPLLIAALISACAGGGNDDTAPAPAPAPVTAASLFAGSLRAPGSADGVGPAAQFFLPDGIAQDAAGVAYVVDSGNATVRKISLDGTVGTIAGRAGQPGHVDGLASLAQFRSPKGAAVDPAGNVYVTDTGNCVIRRIAVQGTVATFAGRPCDPLSPVQGRASIDGAATAATFALPQAITLDAQGNVWVTDAASVRKITTAGDVSTFAVFDPLFAKSYPGIAVTPAGDVLVVANRAFGDATLLRFDAAGRSLPLPVQDRFAAGLLPGAGGIALNPAGTEVLVTGAQDTPYGRFGGVKKVNLATGVVTYVALGWPSLAADGSVTTADLRGVAGISIGTGGRVLVTDRLRASVRRIESPPASDNRDPRQLVGTVSTLAGGSAAGRTDGSATAARFSNPTAIAAMPDGSLRLADDGNAALRALTLTGDVTTVPLNFVDTCIGAPLPGATGFRSLAISPEGQLFAALDRGGVCANTSPYPHAVDPQGNAIQHGAGNASTGRLAAGPLRSVYFTPAGTPDLVRVDGNLVRHPVLPGGVGGAPVGPVAVDAAGTVYFLQGDHVRVVVQGQSKVFAGTPGQPGTVDGAASAARFDGLSAITVDTSGNLFVADASTVRKIDRDGQVRTVLHLEEAAIWQRPPGQAESPVRSMTWSAGSLYAVPSYRDAVVRIAPLP
jgi:sugar lactone lactonase YvrE